MHVTYSEYSDIIIHLGELSWLCKNPRPQPTQTEYHNYPVQWTYMSLLKKTWCGCTWWWAKGFLYNYDYKQILLTLCTEGDHEVNIELFIRWRLVAYVHVHKCTVHYWPAACSLSTSLPFVCVCLYCTCVCCACIYTYATVPTIYPWQLLIGNLFHSNNSRLFVFDYTVHASMPV